MASKTCVVAGILLVEVACWASVAYVLWDLYCVYVQELSSYLILVTKFFEFPQ